MKTNPLRLNGAGSYSYAFCPGGLPFFVLDTRTQREQRSVDGADGTVPLADAQIVSRDDMNRLQAWLDGRAAERHRLDPPPSTD